EQCDDGNTLDGDCCDHAFDRQEIASRTLADEQVVNYPDRLPNGPILPYGGPYDPTKGNHRLAKSFRLGGGPPPTLTPYVPSDLRLDGMYSERHSAPAYFVTTSANKFWDWNAANAHGMVSLWIKPSFYPELTGKVRKFWDMTRYHNSCGAAVNVSPFEMAFWPTQYNPGISETSGGPKFWSNNIGKFEPCSIYFGSKQWHFDDIFTSGNGHEFGKITKCLNHLGHLGEPPKPTLLRAHRWMNTTFSWGLLGGNDASGNYSKLYLNGTELYTPYSLVSMSGFPDYYDRMNGFDKHSGGAYNHMRIGGTSRVALAAIQPSGAYKGNFTADATVDELFVWKSDSDAAFDLQWSRGRYYNVKKEASFRGTFTSQAISLPPAPSGLVKVLGASWTWYGEESDPMTGDRVLYTYSGASGLAGADLQPTVTFSLQDGAMLYGPLSDDGFSPVLNLSGLTPVIGSPASLKYLIDFGMNGGTATSILLATPVLDDVTIYWNDGSASARVDTATPLVITDPALSALPDAPYGQVYTATFTASGASPITWSITGGALPGGLALDPVTGVLSGSPATGGTFTFVLTATTGSNSSGAQYTLTVTGAPAGGGGGGGGGCGLLGLEAAILLALRRRRPTGSC
ncbi:MAG: putative Ig domain-containing protein, partial [Planctomycetes bacterium]|nr:putative Ig domain-containing protein [Planctomycetota bacterium]